MEIEYYVTDNGKSPIEKYLSSLSNGRHVRQILDDIELLAKINLAQLQKTGDVKKIKGVKGDIWELKTSCKDNIIYRTLFEAGFNKIHILHVFNKKDQKIKMKEINKAISRLKYYYETPRVKK